MAMLGLGKTEDTLWTLIAAPTIWGFHFLFSYLLVAWQCAPNGDPFRGIGGTRTLIGGVTLVCLALIGLILRRSWREWRAGEGDFHNNQNTTEARERFLEFSTLLLAVLSFVAVVFETLPIALIGDCR
ncbi:MULTISPECIES: hypothetical protein [unclassified Sulfitobacter]|jgi:hypothetical protein|uniref:hypothetical protein n=3 Tax=Sulfitobacter TaxID=60136 RepID=UPI0007D01B80|nr:MULTISPECIES: hypothetical protein [unclassified Sulfitobacter]KZX94792.1 hypothetical protein A3720_21625 [Sulfitobacter sp. HI0021]KZZ00556.1 hypothetical protein A3747_21440 [Sulfitobacter sp. HI0076]MBL4793786.1 hypothetical protein [Citromicrobium sp.]